MTTNNKEKNEKNENTTCACACRESEEQKDCDCISSLKPFNEYFPEAFDELKEYYNEHSLETLIKPLRIVSSENDKVTLY